MKSIFIFGDAVVKGLSGDVIVAVGSLKADIVTARELFIYGRIQSSMIVSKQAIIRGKALVDKIYADNILIESRRKACYIGLIKARDTLLYGIEGPVIVDELFTDELYAEYALIKKLDVKEKAILGFNVFIREAKRIGSLVFLDPYVRLEKIDKIGGDIVFRY